ncbi:membrane hypothetical protein [uncultured Paludibacter sp.]|nr:membrane hypothetical protein [uncultured Paludibacter sp.]
MQSRIISSAMKYALILGAFFSLNFLFAVSQNSFLILLSNLILILSIVYTYRFTVRYRDIENNGAISYGYAFLYILLLYFFASIIAGAVVLIYCKFVNPAYLLSMMEDPNMQKSISIVTSMMGISEKQVEESLNLLLSPTTYALQYIWGNTFLGVIVGLVLAVFVKKNAHNS